MKVCPRDCIYDANFPKSIKEVMKAEAERKAAAEAKAKEAAEAKAKADAKVAEEEAAKVAPVNPAAPEVTETKPKVKEE